MKIFNQRLISLKALLINHFVYENYYLSINPQ